VKSNRNEPGTTPDPHDLGRFVVAQDAVYDRVLRELRAGRKTSHWMWFVFPQIAGLGYSSMAQRYAIGGSEEAAAYAEHAVLGARLRECTAIVIGLEGRSAHEVFGSPDDLKFRSSMTLFALCAGEADLFQRALEKYFGGEPDPLTVARLAT
jgi:uncharacterized protein (DUF1810 family)